MKGYLDSKISYSEEDIFEINKMVSLRQEKMMYEIMEAEKNKRNKNFLRLWFSDKEIVEDLDVVEIDVDRFNSVEYLKEMLFRPSNDKKDYFPSMVIHIMKMTLCVVLFRYVYEWYSANFKVKETRTIMEKRHSLADAYYKVERDLDIRYGDIIEEINRSA